MRDLFIIVGCWAISFLFNGIEAGLTSIDPVRLRHHVKLNRPAAVRLDRLLKTPECLLVTVLLVTNLADILALLLLTRLLVFRFGTAGFAFTIVIALPIYLFVLGVLPKSLLRRFPFRALSPLARLLEISMITLWPVLAAGAALGTSESSDRTATGLGGIRLLRLWLHRDISRSATRIQGVRDE